MAIEKLLGFLSTWSIILPSFLGIIYINRLFYGTRIILIVTLLALIPQLIHAFDIGNEVVKNLIYNIYTPIEFIFLYLFFFTLLGRQKEKAVLKFSLVVYLLTSLFFILENDLKARFLDEWVCVNNLVYTGWIMMVFYKQYSVANTSKIDVHTAVFWILIGLLFYAPFCSLYFSVYYYAQQKSFAALKIIHHFVNINMYVCFAIGIYKDYKNAGLRHQ